MKVRRVVSSLTKIRPALRGSILEYFAVALLFIVVTYALTGFLQIDRELTLGGPDSTTGFLWLNYAEPGLNLVLGLTDIVNYPVGEVLGGPALITYSMLWVPMRVFGFLFGPFVALNLVMYLGFVSSALCMYWLSKRLTNNYAISIFAGYAAAFVPYAMTKANSHIAYVFSGVFALLLGVFISFWIKPTIGKSILLAAGMAIAFYTDGYYILLGSVFAGALLMGGVIQSLLTKMTLKEYGIRARHLLIAVGAFLIMMLPMVLVQITQGAEVQGSLSASRGDMSAEMREYRAWPADFKLPPLNSRFLGGEKYAQEQAHRAERSNPSESTNYIAKTLLGLSLAGGVLLGCMLFSKKLRRRMSVSPEQWRVLVLVGAVTVAGVGLLLSFMFSPEVVVLGKKISLPGQLLLDHNIALWRVMSRFFVPLHVIVVLFSAVSLWLLLCLAKSFMPTLKWPLLGVVVTVTLLGLVVFEYATTAGDRPYNSRQQANSAYTWLASNPSVNVVAELPFVDPLDSRNAGYIEAQLTHGKKLVNMRDPMPERLNGALGGEDNPEAIDFAYKRGADAAIVRKKSCDRVDWGSLMHEAPVEGKQQDRVCIYRLDSTLKRDSSFSLLQGGFTYRPNAVDQDETALEVGRAGEMSVVTKDLRTRKNGSAVVSTVLYNASGTSIDWSVEQDGVTIRSGKLDPMNQTHIEVSVNSRNVVLWNVRAPGAAGSLIKQYVLLKRTIVQESN